MSAAAVRILVVGNSTAGTESTLRGLARSGWESQAVKTVREADTVLRAIRFQLTLATEKLPDGTGYELAPLIAQQSGNLFVSVPLSETCLWLPAVENGVRSLGQRALNPLMLATEAEFILRACDTTDVRAENGRSDGRISSSEVVGAEALPARAAAELIERERSGRQARERYEDREHVAPRRPVAPRRQVVPGTSVAAERPLPLAREGVVREVVVVGKRWRAL
jgi:DNA-binding NtrC family response regulator